MDLLLPTVYYYCRQKSIALRHKYVSALIYMQCEITVARVSRKAGAKM